MDHALGVHVDDEEGEQRPEPNVVDLQKVTGPNGVVAQERLPALTPMRCGWCSSVHVSLDSALGDTDSELQKFTADSLRSPQPILGCHAPNERNDVGGDAGLVRSSTPRPPTPPEPKSFTVPTKQGLGLDQEQGAGPSRNEPRE